MKLTKQAMIVASFVLAILMMTGCSQDAGTQQTAAAEAPAPASVAEQNPKAEQTDSELAGTSWQLVKIMSMDDSVDEPADPTVYTLEFGDNGRAAMLADCNRGTGTWTSESAGQLQFGPVAATLAMCPPGSLSEAYLAQFEWVRSYVMRDGHLFLATMADGSIIEFEPLLTEPLVATVLGEEIRTADEGEMQQIILTRLFGQYAEERQIAVQDEEINSFVQNMKHGIAADGGQDLESDLTEEELSQIDAMRRDMGKSIILNWKLNQALYSQYGGRIIYQQFGPEPLDAYRTFLEEQQQAGNFTIEDPAFAQKFWQYFTDDSKHDFMAPGSDDETRAFATPPWKQAAEGS